MEAAKKNVVRPKKPPKPKSRKVFVRPQVSEDNTRGAEWSNLKKSSAKEAGGEDRLTGGKRPGTKTSTEVTLKSLSQTKVGENMATDAVRKQNP